MTTDAERQAAFMARVNRLQAQGAKVQLLDARSAVVTENQVNHWAHALVTLLTCGLWLIVWVIDGLTRKPTTRIITADDPPPPAPPSFWQALQQFTGGQQE